MTGTITGTTTLLTGTGTFRNAPERASSSPLVRTRTLREQAGTCSTGTGTTPSLGGSRPCPSCGAQSAEAGFYGHGMHCRRFYVGEAAGA
jgi:hypothetical protein